MQKKQRAISLVLSAALLLSLFQLTPLSAFAQETTEETYLSDMEWSQAQVNSQDTWAQPQKDLNCEGTPIRMIDSSGSAVPYSKGIGFHANGTLTYALDGRYTFFRADVGTDYNNKEKKKPTSIHCAVYVDEETTPRWATTAPITVNTPLQSIEIDVTGASTLKLQVMDAGDGVDSDWSNWGNARLVRTISARELLNRAIAAAETLDENGYTDISWSRFSNALAEAKSVSGDDAQTCNSARSLLKEAQDALVVAYGITLQPTQNGTLTAQPSGKVGAGESVIFQVLPVERYRLYRLYVNGMDVTKSVDASGCFTLTDVTKAVTATATFESERLTERYLSDMNWAIANTALGKQPVKDANINYTPINVYGNVYVKGLGLHAGHEVVYQLGGSYQKLTAIAAPDNGCNAEEDRNMSIMGLVIYADGAEIFRNDHINFHRQHQIPLELALEGVQELKIVATNGDNGNDWSDDLNLADAKLYYVGNELTGIQIDGKELTGYHPSVHEYSIEASGAIPEVSATTLPGVEYTVTQATANSDTAVIQVAGQIYTIRFFDAAAFQTFGVELPQNQLLRGDGILHAQDVYVTIPEGMDRSNVAPVFTAGNWSTVTVNGVAQQSGVSTQNFTSPVVYTVANARESRSYTVRLGTWHDIPTQFADENSGVLERPSMVNYPGTLTMKLVLSVPVQGSQTESHVSARFDDALEIIRQLDNVTRGIPKVVYLVGWQYQGHDDKYPAWGQVNDHLKCASCEHPTSLDCMKWLMDEAYEHYNTAVSMHINSTDAYKDSPLWQTYVDNDLISKTIIGTLKIIGTWEGETAYQVNYHNEWEKGFYKQRVDSLLEMFDGRIQRAGTIHSDAFFCRSSKQSNVRTEQEARLRMMRYWRDCGVDLTTEFLHNGNEKNAGGDGSGLLGVCPMTWHFNQSIQSYMTRPASMVTGGGINDIDYGDDKETVEILFGRSMWGEDLLTQREIYGLDHRPNWDVEFRRQFCTQTLPWAYQNTFDRLRLEGNVVFYSDGLMANANNRTVTRDSMLIREKDDVFVPVVWRENEVIAYSADGYTDKTWRFQKEFGASSVDIYSVDKDGTELLDSDVDVSSGTITLTLSPGQMVSIVPADTAV